MSQRENKLMSIGEVAKSLGVTRRMILNYEAKGLLVPDKKDGPAGNRYYTADSASKILTIRALQNCGLSLDEIYAYYNDMTDIEPLINRLEIMRNNIDLHIEKLKVRAKLKSTFHVETITIPAQTVYFQKVYAETTPIRAEYLRVTFVNALRRFSVDTSSRPLFTEYSLTEPNAITNYVAIPSDTPDAEDIIHLPEEKALAVFHHGSYDTIPETSAKLVAYAEQNNIPLKGLCRRIFIEGPPQRTDPSKYVTQVAVLIK